MKILLLVHLPFLVLVIFVNSVTNVTSRIDILSFKNVRTENDGYQFEYEGKDGTKRQETGTFIYKTNSTPVLHVKGSYSYRDGFGRFYTVHYEAGDKGTKTTGDIIPPFSNNNYVSNNNNNNNKNSNEQNRNRNSKRKNSRAHYETVQKKEKFGNFTLATSSSTSEIPSLIVKSVAVTGNKDTLNFTQNSDIRISVSEGTTATAIPVETGWKAYGDQKSRHFLRNSADDGTAIEVPSEIEKTRRSQLAGFEAQSNTTNEYDYEKSRDFVENSSTEVSTEAEKVDDKLRPKWDSSETIETGTETFAVPASGLIISAVNTTLPRGGNE